MLLAGVRVPSGSWNTLVDCLPVGTKAWLSFIVPTWEVAPLSAMADGMEPLRTPCRISQSKFVVSDNALMRWLWSCSLTWRAGGAVSDKIA